MKKRYVCNNRKYMFSYQKDCFRGFIKKAYKMTLIRAKQLSLLETSPFILTC